MESFDFKSIILLTICIILLSQDVLAGKQCSTGLEHFKPIVFAPTTILRDVFRKIYCEIEEVPTFNETFDHNFEHIKFMLW